MSPPLLVFGEDWGRHPSSTQHLIRRLAARHPVVWVDSIGLRRPRLGVADLRRVRDKLLGQRQPPSEAIPVQRVRPLAWPGAALAWERWVNRQLIRWSVAPALATGARPILWASLPSAADALGAFGERAVVYYCGDDFGALAGVDHATALAQEQRLAARADLILCASPRLAQRFASSRTEVVEHGVDLALFATPQPPAADLPSGPVLGFYGALAPWLDTDLIAALADRLPDWTLLFIGPAAGQPLPVRANILWLGPRPHSQLPSYAQHWQAGWLPFRACDQITACNPLKLREYLAAGRPVLATEFPALDRYRDLVATPRTLDAWVAVLRASATAPDRRAEIRLRLACEDWDARAARVAALLAHLA